MASIALTFYCRLGLNRKTQVAMFRTYCLFFGDYNQYVTYSRGLMARNITLELDL